MKNAYEMKKHAHLQQSVNHYGTVSMKSFTVFYRLTLSLTYKLYLSFNTFGLIVFYDKLHINFFLDLIIYSFFRKINKFLLVPRSMEYFP